MLVHQKQATGELIINNNSTQYRLCFFLGQLLYAIKETHRIRRWQRGLKRYCPNWVIDNSQLINSEIWECELLHQGMIEGRLNAAQVKALVREITQEVLFSLNPYVSSKYQWRTCKYAKSESTFYLTLCPLEIKQILKNCQNLWQQWQDMGLAYINPEFAPVVKQSPSVLTKCSADTFLNLTALFNGHYTLWDIAFKMKQPLLRVGRLLHYFYQQGLLELQTVSDLPIPYKCNLQIKGDSHGKKQPVIVCIDDSPLVGKYLKEILTPAGYQVFYIQDPVGGIATLTKCKPDLIFLDLVMPNTDGYNLCRFFRKISTFRKTPIIMLTAWDGWINRARAKLVGADDFLAKPFKTEQLKEIIAKYISP
ncbi:response regulator [Floridanema aerugineum]|uniref:Protein PatA n=1 Tax=Floridaenema aerugineum BLCC-F46 TaxID=3153654 RepID=A0ABV4XB15_9CYAN